MKKKKQTDNVIRFEDGELKPSDLQQSTVPESSVVQALADAYDKIVASRPKNHEEEQVQAAAKWAIRCLHQSARMANTPGLKSAIWFVETGLRDIGKAVFPNP